MRKNLKLWMEGRMDQVQELVIKNLEHTTQQFKLMGDHISNLNQKLQITNAELALKLTKVFKVFRQAEKEKQSLER